MREAHCINVCERDMLRVRGTLHECVWERHTGRERHKALMCVREVLYSNVCERDEVQLCVRSTLQSCVCERQTALMRVWRQAYCIDACERDTLGERDTMHCCVWEMPPTVLCVWEEHYSDVCASCKLHECVHDDRRTALLCLSDTRCVWEVHWLMCVRETHCVREI